MTCNCSVCALMNRIRPLQAKATPDEAAALEEILNRWEVAETDATYYRLCLQGKWRPTHKEAKDAR